MDIQEIFKLMVEKEASDLYLRTRATIRGRINGQVVTILDHVVSREEMTAITNFLLANEQRRRQYIEERDIDFIHEEPQIGRFRINIFNQRGTSALVARHVHTTVRTFEELNLPTKVCEMFCNDGKGLFLVCGPAGNGKSTTSAAMIQYINQTSAKHIITIEDPIEFMFTDDQSLINQRELGIDVTSYPSALKHVTQQSPDMIYIGTIRDLDTMKAAVGAAELGLFVITTFHTINAVQTITRMINFFPPHMHDEMRIQMSTILKGSISLRLVPRKDGKGRIPAYEVMMVTPTISRLIRENKISEIQNFINDGESVGMLSFKQSLLNLIESDMITPETGYQFADSKDEFDLALRGIRSKFK